MSYSDVIAWTDISGRIDVDPRIPRIRELQARSMLAALNTLLMDAETGPYFKDLLAQGDTGTLQFIRLRIMEQVTQWLRDDNPERWIKLMRRLHEGIHEQSDWRTCIAPSGAARSNGQENWEYPWDWLWVIATQSYAYSTDASSVQRRNWKEYAGRPDPPNRFDCVIELIFRSLGDGSEYEYIGAYYRYATPNDFADIIVTIDKEEAEYESPPKWQ